MDELIQTGVDAIFFAFGDGAARIRLAQQVVEMGFTMPVIVHPRAVVAADVSLGQGTFVAAGAVINAQARIGSNVIVNTSASVDHESVIEDGAHIAGAPWRARFRWPCCMGWYWIAQLQRRYRLGQVDYRCWCCCGKYIPLVSWHMVCLLL